VLGQNPNLCESGPCDQQTKDKSKKNNPVIYILASVSAFLMLLLIVLAVVNIIYIKKRKLKDDVYIHMESGDPLESKRRQYSFDEVVNMTNNFERVLDRGRFGTVYYGIIDDIPVVVKMLLQSSAQGYQEFLTEVNLIIKMLAITLSTYIVSHNNALFALLVSNNFAQIKSNVFKRYSGDNVYNLVYFGKLLCLLEFIFL
ncbi:hypothetical protein HN873_038974, partial [Arachis hypogaea]